MQVLHECCDLAINLHAGNVKIITFHNFGFCQLKTAKTTYERQLQFPNLHSLEKTNQLCIMYMYIQ